MIGRALTSRPWMMWQLGERLGWPEPEGREGQKAPSTPEEEAQEYGRSLLVMLEYFKKYFPENLGMRKFTFYLKVSHPWLDFGHRLAAGCSSQKNYDELIDFITYFFAKSTYRLSQKTQLRY